VTPESSRWAVDYSAMRMAVEQARSELGSLLEHWPASPTVTEQRLREVWTLLSAVSTNADYERLIRRLRRWDERESGPLSRYAEGYVAAARQWGLANGYQVRSSGRLSNELMDAYDQWVESQDPAAGAALGQEAVMEEPEIVYLPPSREDKIRASAEVQVLSLPPEQREEAVERIVAAGLERPDPLHRPKVRVEVPASLHPSETNVYLDGQKISSVVAVRFQPRSGGAMDTYVVLRIRDADVQWPEGAEDWDFGRLDLSMRTIKGFESGSSVSPRSTVRLEKVKDRAIAYENLRRLGLSPEDMGLPG
jgi:hypothetical protein